MLVKINIRFGLYFSSFSFFFFKYFLNDKAVTMFMSLSCSKNRGGIETAKFLLKLIGRAPKLIAVNAAYNRMPAESLTLICSALKTARGS